VAAASAALIAGCGSSSNPPTTTKPATTKPAATKPAATKPAATTPAATSPAGVVPTAAELKAAGTACQTALAHVPSTFGSAAVTYLKSVCSDLQSGNLTAAKSDAQKYCYAVLAAVPAAAKPAAQAECAAISKDF
jgi:hypothetical protein